MDVFMDAARLPRATDWKEVPTTALIPAFMLSELKVAFAMGFNREVEERLPFYNRATDRSAELVPNQGILVSEVVGEPIVGSKRLNAVVLKE